MKTKSYISKVIIMVLMMCLVFATAVQVSAADSVMPTAAGDVGVELDFDKKYTGHNEAGGNAVYKIELPKAGKIDVTCLSTYYEGRVRLYDGNFQSMESYTKYGNSIGVCSIMFEEYLLKGTYYIEIESAYKTEAADYEITVKYLESNVAFEESYDNNNNDVYNAYTIELSKNYTGQMCTQNIKDVYKLTLKDKKEVMLKFSIGEHEWDDHVDVTIYDSNYEKIKRYDGFDNDFVLNEYHVFEKGTYYFLIESNGYNEFYGVYNFMIEEHTHEYGDWVIESEATCCDTGERYKKCSVCEKVEREFIPVNDNHDLAVIEGYDATCTEEGLTDGEECIDCGETLKEQVDIPVKPHTIVTDKFVAATQKAAGKTEGSHCSVCKTIFVAQKRIAKISTVKFTKIKQSYTGKMATPTVTVKDVKGKTLTAGKDYTITYKTPAGIKVSTPKAVGKYVMYVTFKGNYSGMSKITYTVAPKATAVTKVTTPAKKQIKVTWTKRTAQVDGYEIQYSTTSKFTNATTKTLKVKNYKTNSKVIKKLKAKKTYWVKVRTYKTVNGVKYYSNWSKVKKVKTK